MCDKQKPGTPATIKVTPAVIGARSEMQGEEDEAEEE